MAHEVEQMAFAGETPWHGLGNRLEGNETPQEVIVKAGLDWQVETVPVYRKVGESYVECKMGRAAIRMSDDSELGAVGPRWTPYQNDSMFKCFEPMVQNGLMTWHTAGSLRDGQRVWCLCQLALDNCEITKGDEIRKFAMISNGHDGKLAVRIGFTPIRVVCANTLALAHGDEASSLIRVRHNRLVTENVDKLRDIMNLANQEFEASCDQYRLLAGRGISQDDLRKYVKIVLGVKQGESEDISTRQKNIIEKVIELFETGKGHEVAGDTWWKAYNALTEYASWVKGRSNENRMASVWFGQDQTLLKQALNIALVMSEK